MGNNRSIIDFETLLKDYGKKIYNLAARILGDKLEAEDTTQEIFLKVYEKQDTFRGESALYTWIYRIAVNHCLKKKARLSAEIVNQATESLDLDNKTLPKEVQAWQNDPEKVLYAKELLAEIRKECYFFVVFILSEKQRIVFLLRTLLNLSFKEIGQVLDITENTAKARMNRSRERLEKDMKARCSQHSKEGKCNCNSCVRHVAVKFPHILKQIKGNAQFIEEAAEAFRHKDNIEELYTKLPDLEYKLKPIQQYLNPSAGSESA